MVGCFLEASQQSKLARAFRLLAHSDEVMGLRQDFSDLDRRSSGSGERSSEAV
jgi:hypothetical protein